MKKPYKCPRCGYETPLKSDMRKHLYKLKKVCPGQVNDIDLTEEMKEKILLNRILHMATPQPPVYQQNIQVNNFIANQDIPTKINAFNKHNKCELIGFDKYVEDKFYDISSKLSGDQFKYGYELNKDDLLDVINQVCKLDHDSLFQHLNMYYDKNVDRINIYDYGEWEELLINKGVKKILQTIQSYYWDDYETYLQQKMDCETNLHLKQQLRESIVEYYSFISCFDVEPCIKTKCDIDADLYDRYYKLYVETRDNVRKSDINYYRKAVLDILKKNSDRNINELNKNICSLFNIDEQFKALFVRGI